jgi:hypothetical protein
MTIASASSTPKELLRPRGPDLRGRTLLDRFRLDALLAFGGIADKLLPPDPTTPTDNPNRRSEPFQPPIGGFFFARYAHDAARVRGIWHGRGTDTSRPSARPCLCAGISWSTM